MAAAGWTAATFLARPNRFIVRAALPGGDEVDAHLADPGRLRELLRPGAELRLRAAKPSAVRRTRYTVALVRATAAPRPWVSVETARANDLAATLLAGGLVHGVSRDLTVRREARRGASRFDFRLDAPRRPPLWVEVKSVTLVENGLGLFPDAPTARGRRHVGELTEAVRAGDRALVLFVAQRGDARSVAAHRGIDPAFADLLRAARRTGVLLRAAAFRFDAWGRPTYRGPLPVR